MFIPQQEVDITGDIRIRYEKHPWIEQFEFDGLHPRTPLRAGYGSRAAKSFAESLSKIYAKAYDDYIAKCSDKFVSEDNPDGLDTQAYFAEVADHFVRLSGREENLPMCRKFCGYTENIWRYGNKSMHDIALEVILPIIDSNPETEKLFYDTITREFREYIEDNNYGKKESKL